MDELISRKAVLKIFGDVHPLDYNARAYVKQIEELPTISQTNTAEWIPVSERLPERDVDVLAYCKNVCFEYQYILWIDDYSGKWVGFDGRCSDKVLAWMPLPEPYKAESEEEE